MKRTIVAVMAGVLVLGGAGVVMRGGTVAAQAQQLFAVSREGRSENRDVGEVMVKRQVVMRLYATAGGLSPIERADVVASRLNRLQEDKPLRAAEIRVERSGTQYTVYARDVSLISVLPEDARAAGQSASETANAWMDDLSSVLAGKEIAPARDEDRRGLRDEDRNPRNDRDRDFRDRDDRDRDDRDRDDRDRDRRDRDDRRGDRYDDGDLDTDEYDPQLKTKIVPIITVGSSLNVGVAQVAGEERDVRRCKAVAQLETDYKDRARIKILVPVQSEKIVQNIDRVPGVSVRAVGDYAIKK